MTRSHCCAETTITSPQLPHRTEWLRIKWRSCALPRCKFSQSLTYISARLEPKTPSLTNTDQLQQPITFRSFPQQPWITSSLHNKQTTTTTTTTTTTPLVLTPACHRITTSNQTTLQPPQQQPNALKNLHQTANKKLQKRHNKATIVVELLLRPQFSTPLHFPNTEKKKLKTCRGASVRRMWSAAALEGGTDGRSLTIEGEEKLK